MAVTQTANKSFNLVTVGTESGTWGPYVNANQSLLDNMLGGITTIALNNTPVVLSSAQYQCNFIVFTGALTGNVAVTFPPVGSFYTIVNETTNSSAFLITLQTSTVVAQIGCPPGDITDVATGPTAVLFRNLPRVGSYWDHCGSSVPAWVSACSIPPYLKCDGSTFNAATYPALNAYMGGNTLPDFRGRYRAYNDEGVGRITGGTFLSAGGNQSVSIAQAHLPAFDMATTVTDPGHVHPGIPSAGAGAGVNYAGGNGNNTQNSGSATTGVSVVAHSGGSGTPLPTLSPVQLGGITMVRAG